MASTRATLHPRAATRRQGQAVALVRTRPTRSRARSPENEPGERGLVAPHCDASLSLASNWEAARKAPNGAVDVIDMFSGCGGMSCGFVSLNSKSPTYRIAAAVDIDKVANLSYQQNIGVHPALEDVSALAKSRTKRQAFMHAAGVDGSRPLVLIGCAPCQGFSSHRNSTTSDPRNSLFSDFVKVAVAVRPTVVLIENVPELLTNRYWPFVADARNRLEAAGYYVHVAAHNMAHFGVPQERFRALMLAMRHPFNPPAGFLNRDRFRTVRDAIGTLRPIEAGERDPIDPMHFTAGHKPSTIKTIQAVPLDGGSRPEHVGPDCLRRAKAKNGRAVYEDVYGRLYWDRPAITITAHARNPASGRYVHPAQHRGLSVREAALLQSFPPTFGFAGSLDEKFRQIGNAVPPAFSAFLASWIAHQVGHPEPVSVSSFDRGICDPVGPSFSRLIPAIKAGHRSAAVRTHGA
jgi:DNA (cytosine-5)-methyltransferase 1